MSSQASSTSTPVPSTPKTRPRRQSRFTEGSPVTGPEIFTGESSSNEFLFTILHEMDEHERKRKHRNSNASSSAESFSSHASSPRSSAEKFNVPSPQDKRRSIVFAARKSAELISGRRSLDERPMEVEKTVKTFKGRLRALTGGQRERNAKPYHGT